VVNVIDPEIIQIGNEVNSGMLHPYGNISAQKGQFIQLLQGLLIEMMGQGKDYMEIFGIERH
jgi:arabinogalactan endo-1,4-beta-galactosidase